MAGFFVDRVWFTTATVGAGDITVGSALPAYRTPVQAGMSAEQEIPYVIEDGNNYETGRGRLLSSGTVFERTTIYESSNSNNALSLSGNARVLFTILTYDHNAIRLDLSALANSLGNAAFRNVGTTAGTVAAGDDSRIVGAAADTAVVHKSGDEVITGIKTFNYNRLRLYEASNIYALRLLAGGFTADQDLVLNIIGPAQRTLSLQGDLAILGNTFVSGSNTGDQTLASLGAADDSLVAHLAGTETFTGLKTFQDIGLRVLDSGGSGNNMRFRCNETLTASVNLNFRPNGASRIITLQGNITVSGDATVSGNNLGDDYRGSPRSITSGGNYNSQLADEHSVVDIGCASGETVNYRLNGSIAHSQMAPIDLFLYRTSGGGSVTLNISAINGDSLKTNNSPIVIAVGGADGIWVRCVKVSSTEWIVGR